MAKRRVEYLDAIKGVSILLVVFCHYVLLPAESILGNVVMALCWVAVPLFLMVSGVLLNSAKEFSWKKHFIKMGKIYTVLSIWKIICLIVAMAFSDVTFTIPQLINYVFFCGNIDNVVSVSWYMEAFLMALFIHPITYYLLKKGDDGKTIFNFIVGLLFFSSFGKMFIDLIFTTLQKHFGFDGLSLNDLINVLPFWKSSNIIFFFLFGTFLKVNEDKFNLNIPEKVKKVIPYFCVVIGVLGLVAFKYFWNKTIRWNGIYIDNGYCRLSTVLMAYGFWNIFLEKDNVVIKFFAKSFGKYTMGIFYIHFIVLYVSDIVLYKYLWEYASFGLNLLKTIIVAVVCVVATKIISYIPVLKQLVK